jgi:hypothetical protein
MSATEVTLEPVHILGDDGLISTGELASTAVVAKGAFVPFDNVLFDIHDEMVEEEWRVGGAR